MKLLPKTVFLLAVISVGACTRYIPNRTSTLPRAAATTRDRYEDQILRSELAANPAYTEWANAARRALRERLTIRPSFKELLYFSPERASAVGYRLELKRGQRLHIELEPRMRGRVFAEVFEEIGSDDPIFRLVHSASTSDAHIAFEATTDGAHVLRLQPELFKGGEILVTVSTAAALTFPVSGKSSRAIGSYFGDPRDGGKRDHEGIDIFAKAGTAVIAVAPGIITAVNTTKIGGKVVWQRDPQRNVDYYYAHLKTQDVRAGDRVNAGDVIGTVGNTGNARTTPPHLHFAVYKPGRSPIDPVPFLYDQPSEAGAPLLVDLAALGDIRSPKSDKVALRREPNADGAPIATVTRNQDVYVIGGVRDWYRVRLHDGRGGFVRARDLGVSYSSKGAH